MNYPTIKFETLKDLKTSKEIILFNLIKNWDLIVKPHLQSPEIIAALKYGFSDHFHDEEEVNDYEWENPRLDSLGAIGFEELHNIMDEETFKAYIGEEYDEYIESLEKSNGDLFGDEDENETTEDYKDFVKDGSYFAYRALGRCHHLAPFLYELGKKMFPEYDWYIFETPAHSNAVGVKNGEIHLVIDLLWGESHKTPQSLLSVMFIHSVRIVRVQMKEKFTEEQFKIIENLFHTMKDNLLT